MAEVLKKIYSCGATISYLEKDGGKSFICHRCGHVHSYPGKPKTKSKDSPKPPYASIRTEDTWWPRFFIWLSNLFSFKKQIIGGGNRLKAPERKVQTIPLPMTNLSLPIVTLSTELKTLKNELIRQTWHRDAGPIQLTLSPSQLSPPNWQQCLTAMLRHAEKVAPKLFIPFMIPALSFQDELLHTAGGTFQVKSDGSVLITIKKPLEHQPRVALAVLTHELCHYILGTNNIRKEDTLLNEKMTDVCIFVLGLGKIFLNGQQDISGTTYGYLHRDQYQSLIHNIEAKWLIRDTFNDIDTEVDEMEKWAIRAIGMGDRSRYEYVYKRMKAKYPTFSKKEILSKLKYDFLR